jgi:hypothetical protein
MMIKLTYEQLNQALFPVTVTRLCREGRFSPKVAYALMKLNQALDKETTTARDLFRAVVKQHCELDEAGEPKQFPEENLAYKPREGEKEAFEKAMAEMLKIEFEVSINPIGIDQIDAGCRMSPQEMDALTPVLDFAPFA